MGQRTRPDQALFLQCHLYVDTKHYYSFLLLLMSLLFVLLLLFDCIVILIVRKTSHECQSRFYCFTIIRNVDCFNAFQCIKGLDFFSAIYFNFLLFILVIFLFQIEASSIGARYCLKFSLQTAFFLLIVIYFFFYSMFASIPHYRISLQHSSTSC